MKSIQLWQLYKNKSVQSKGTNFLNWVEINHPQINIRGFYDRFMIDWLHSNNNIFSNKTFIVWLCKNYRYYDLDYYEND